MCNVSYHRDILLLWESFIELCWSKTLTPEAEVQLQNLTLPHSVSDNILKSHTVAVKQFYSPLLAPD